MATPHGIQNIEKLTEENCESWKIQMRSVLVCNDMWEYVNGTIPKSEENAAVWTVKDQKALALIVLSMSRGQWNYVKRVDTSKAAWKRAQACSRIKRTSEKSYTLQTVISHEERSRNFYEHVHK